MSTTVNGISSNFQWKEGMSSEGDLFPFLKDPSCPTEYDDLIEQLALDNLFECVKLCPCELSCVDITSFEDPTG
jgi:hypothetical protein